MKILILVAKYFDIVRYVIVSCTYCKDLLFFSVTYD